MAPGFPSLVPLFRDSAWAFGFSHHHAWPLDFNDCIYGWPTISALSRLPGPGRRLLRLACLLRAIFSTHRRRDEPGAEKGRRGLFSPWKDDMGGGTAFSKGETWITLLSGLPA